ncbi:type II secretion system major pseudopilin GspG [Halovulum sp. GXIMD14793]
MKRNRKPLHARWSRQAGATLLEILVVLSILVLIAAVVGPRVIGYLGRAKSETAGLQIDALSEAVQLYYIDMGRYPTEAEGLGALTSAPAADPAWAGPYIASEEALTDPWGRDYIYVPPGNGTGFSVQSLGADGARGGSGEDADLRS